MSPNSAPIRVPGWPVDNLIDLCEFVNRGRAPQYISQSSIRAIGQKCIRETFQGNEARFQDSKRISGHLFAKKGDVLLNSTGTGTIGRSCVFNEDMPYIVDGHVTVVRPCQQKCSSSFLNSLLKTEQYQRFLEVYCYTGSTNQIELSAAAVAKLKLCLPSTQEQHAIATILDTMDEAIRRTEAVIAKLRQVKAGMLHDLLTRGLDENGELRDPIRHPEQFKKTSIGLIPNEWEIAPLEKLAKITSGITLGNSPQGTGTIELPYLRVANVQDGYLDLLDIKTVRIYKKDIDRFALRKGDVLMNEGGDYDKLGRGAVWEGQIEPCIHQNHVFRVRPFPESLNSHFLDAVSGSHYGKGYFLFSSKQSTNLASINSTQLKRFPIPCPEMNEQTAIMAAISAFDRAFDIENNELEKLKKTKQGLMHDLLTGRVRIPPQLLEAVP